MALQTTQPPAAPPPETSISLYARRAEIAELKARFVAGLKIKNASDHEYKALAHLCAKYALDPFNSEAWIIPGNGVMVGIKGLRKMANRQAHQLGFRYWTEFHDVRSAAERDQYGIPDDAQIAVLCHLRRSDHIEAYAHTLKLMQTAGNLDFKMIIELLGRPPVIVGIGYVKKGESSKMPIPQLVRKRAEMHALKQAFDVDVLTEGDTVNGEVVESKWIDDLLVEGDDDDPPAEPEKLETVNLTGNKFATRPIEEGQEVVKGQPDQPEASQPITTQAAAPAPADVQSVIAQTAAGMGSPMRREPSGPTFAQLRTVNPNTLSHACSLLNDASRAIGGQTWSQEAVAAVTAHHLNINKADVKLHQHWVNMIAAVEAIALKQGKAAA